MPSQSWASIMLACLLGAVFTIGSSGLFSYTAYIGGIIKAWFHQHGSVADQNYFKWSNALWGQNVKILYSIAAAGFALSFVFTAISAIAAFNLVYDVTETTGLGAAGLALLSTVWALIIQLIVVSQTWVGANTFRNNPAASLELQSKFLAGFSLVFPSLGALLVLVAIVSTIIYLFCKGNRNRKEHSRFGVWFTDYPIARRFHPLRLLAIMIMQTRNPLFHLKTTAVQTHHYNRSGGGKTGEFTVYRETVAAKSNVEQVPWFGAV